jgi:hypothetical protein
MIPFFRKIRQTLLMKNRTAQYLTYAIGEILLVVIGILIALQINTWNEERVARKNEAKILQTLLEDLKSAKTYSLNSIKIEELSIGQYRRVLKGGESRMEFLESPYMDSLFLALIWNVSGGDAPFINSFSDLKNAGQTGLISNEEIRSSFTALENKTIALNTQLADRLSVQQMQGDHLAMESMNFVQMVNSKNKEDQFEVAARNNYAVLLEDQRLLNLIAAKYNLSRTAINDRKSLLAEIENLIGSIEKELSGSFEY